MSRARAALFRQSRLQRGASLQRLRFCAVAAVTPARCPCAGVAQTSEQANSLEQGAGGPRRAVRLRRLCCNGSTIQPIRARGFNGFLHVLRCRPPQCDAPSWRWRPRCWPTAPRRCASCGRGRPSTGASRPLSRAGPLRTPCATGPASRTSGAPRRAGRASGTSAPGAGRAPSATSARTSPATQRRGTAPATCSCRELTGPPCPATCPRPRTRPGRWAAPTATTSGPRPGSA